MPQIRRNFLRIKYLSFLGRKRVSGLGFPVVNSQKACLVFNNYNYGNTYSYFRIKQVHLIFKSIRNYSHPFRRLDERKALVSIEYNINQVTLSIRRQKYIRFLFFWKQGRGKKKKLDQHKQITDTRKQLLIDRGHRSATFSRFVVEYCKNSPCGYVRENYFSDFRICFRISIKVFTGNRGKRRTRNNGWD